MCVGPFATEKRQRTSRHPATGATRAETSHRWSLRLKLKSCCDQEPQLTTILTNFKNIASTILVDEWVCGSISSRSESQATSCIDVAARFRAAYLKCTFATMFNINALRLGVMNSWLRGDEEESDMAMFDSSSCARTCASVTQLSVAREV